ncbi:MAG: polyamine aminopropyltransferase [Bdellovibrionales bacterium]|nr:polyamine aminopropyltransferase [Bdellovibrionales bacterium]
MLNKKQWFTEIHQDSSALSFKYKKTLFEGKSPFQTVKIIETKSHGKMLINEDIVMTCERDEFIYHEMIAHVPLFTHPHPKKALIIGGGDGGTAREILKHKKIKNCDLVEIDSMVVNACKKHLKSIGSAFNDPRLKIYFEDGAAFIKNKKNHYDVIIVDSADPIGPGKVLFETPFYKNVFEALKPDGLMTAQGESPLYEQKLQKTLLKTAGKIFPLAGFYNYGNLTYPGGVWSFLFASKKYHPIKDFKAGRVKNSAFSFRYYNKDIHQAAFSQPEFTKKNLGTLWKL